MFFSRLHGDTPKPKAHQCPTCDFETDYREFMDKHSANANVHHECPDCPFVTYSAQLLDRHKGWAKHKKAEPRPVKCKICDYRTIYGDSLERHEASPDHHECNGCEYVTYAPALLMKHKAGARHKATTIEQMEPRSSPDSVSSGRSSRPQSVSSNTEDSVFPKATNPIAQKRIPILRYDNRTYFLHGSSSHDL